MPRLLFTLFLVLNTYSLFGQSKTDTVRVDSSKQATITPQEDSIQLWNKKVSKKSIIDAGTKMIDEGIVKLLLQVIEYGVGFGTLMFGIYLWFSFFKENLPQFIGNNILFNLLGIAFPFVLLYYSYDFILGMVNFILFKEIDPKPDQLRFTNIYDNLISYYTSLNSIPLFSKLVSTIIFLGAILGTLKAAYELFIFYTKRSEGSN